MKHLRNTLFLIPLVLTLVSCGGGGSGDTSAPAQAPVIGDGDGDGVEDGSDLCPTTPSGELVGANGCTLPPPDSDGDGVIDADDLCANTPTGDIVDADGCTVPPPVTDGDGDGDGVIDADDLCSGTPAGTMVDADGCAASATKLSGTASASSNSQPAAFAFDGNMTSRWESTHGMDPSFLTLDLNAAATLTQVTIFWEAANAESYVIEGSNDNVNWSQLASFSGGTFGDRTDTQNISGIYRFVRMNGTARSVGNTFGYSIWEMEIYGVAGVVSDQDGDGVVDAADLCPDTQNGTPVDAVGCPVVVVPDDDNDGVSNADDLCPDTPTGTIVDAVGCAVTLGEITALFDLSTPLETDTQFDRGDALVTRFSDRPRTRHAREDEFQSYDHYVPFYFENRSSNIEIVDYVAKGGDTIEMNVRTLFPLSPIEAENRWWYEGISTVAQYAGNGLMDSLGFNGTYYQYQKIDNVNRRLGNAPIQVGDRMEFEISQFSDSGIPRGQSNYYGTVFLYIVGEGIVPWYAEAAGSQFREDSQKIPEQYWLGGHTSIHYQYSNEPNDHFMQMATNLGYDNGQTFLLGRRIHHSSFVDGSHDEVAENGVLGSNAGLTGTNFINERCSDCHERNGGAPVANNGQLLDRWVFKVGDANGNPDPDVGRVLQPRSTNGAGEGNVSISSWTELGNGLRTPNYQFSNGTPASFSARIAPRLVGLGLLEAIPESSVLANEDIFDSNGDGISGKANRIVDSVTTGLTRLGRFGWKASTYSVRHQAAAALNTDIGVRTSVLPNPDCGSNQNDCGTESPLMLDEELDKLVLYLSTLGVRPQRVWQTGVEDQSVLQGQEIFKSIGCESCHTETMQTSAFHPLAEVRDQTIHPYSDLLLHDMGTGLADSLGEGLASGSEWRTTPLWGLGLAACVTGGVVNPTGKEGDEDCTPHHAYLHDGRARSVDEAIRWHGGESQDSNTAYQGLSDAQQQMVLDFLNSL